MLYSILMYMRISEIQTKTAPIFRSYGVARASVFGSFARNEERGDSDIDVLVELQKPIGVFRLVGLKQELEECVGRRVDVVVRGSEHPLLTPHIEADAQPIYEV